MQGASYDGGAVFKVTPALCQRCGACCSLLIDGELIACRHLTVAGGIYRCSIYTTRPQVCRDYDCTREAVNPVVADRVRAAMQAAA